MKKILLRHIHAGARYVPKKGEEGYPFQVPEKIYFFHSHYRNPGRRSNNKDAASCSRAIRQEFPEITICGKVIHTHSCCNQRHIVDNCRKNTNGNNDQAFVADALIHNISKVGQMTCCFQCGNGNQYSQKKKNTWHIYLSQGVNNR